MAKIAFKNKYGGLFVIFAFFPSSEIYQCCVLNQNTLHKKEGEGEDRVGKPLVYCAAVELSAVQCASRPPVSYQKLLSI